MAESTEAWQLCRNGKTALTVVSYGFHNATRLPTTIHMSVIEYTLYRVKFVRKKQGSLLKGPDLTPAEILKTAIEERPSYEMKDGKTWHIGNYSDFGNGSGYFAIGRSTKALVAKFDESSGDFVEEDIETSPYTHCVFQTEIGLIGIARKSSLNRTTHGLATWLQLLFEETHVVEETNVTVEVLPVRNPQDFVEAVRSAWSVTKFTAHFRGPNPIDSDELFQKPLSVYAKTINGSYGKTEVSGKDLDKTVVVEVSKSTAAMGNDASANIRDTEGGKQRVVSLKENYVKRSYEDAVHDSRQVVSDLVEAYQAVRTND